jgi:thiol-disulfide isomerase/thioredoxin
VSSRPYKQYIAAVVACMAVLLLGMTACSSKPGTSTPPNATLDTPAARSTPNLLESAPAQVSEPAIEFALQNLSGEYTWLSDLRGKVVIITFWATWCGPCRSEIPELNNVYLDLEDKGIEILAVDVRESPDVVNAFVKDTGINYPVLLDSRGYLAYAYGIRGIPTSLFIDRLGVLRDVRVGAVTEEIIRSILKSIDNS